MKRSAVFLATLLFLSCLALAHATSYTVKSFKMLGDEAVSKMLSEFSDKNSLQVVSCDIYEAELVCVFRPKSSK